MFNYSLYLFDNVHASNYLFSKSNILHDLSMFSLPKCKEAFTLQMCLPAFIVVIKGGSPSRNYLMC